MLLPTIVSCTKDNTNKQDDSNTTADQSGNNGPSKGVDPELKAEVEGLLESKHKLTFNDDGSFRVLILADIHMSAASNPTTTENIKKRIKFLVDKENPNLVIFTGDNTIGSSSSAIAKNNISAMVSYIEEKQIPWCHVYGNHDHENALTLEK